MGVDGGPGRGRGKSRSRAGMRVRYRACLDLLNWSHTGLKTSDVVDDYFKKRSGVFPRLCLGIRWKARIGLVLEGLEAKAEIRDFLQDEDSR